jgi:hypothetical protein
MLRLLNTFSQAHTPVLKSTPMMLLSKLKFSKMLSFTRVVPLPSIITPLVKPFKEIFLNLLYSTLALSAFI